METNSTLLYAYLPLADFFGCLGETAGTGLLRLTLGSLPHVVPERDYLFGLGLLREAFALYEERRGIDPGMSKRGMPFFRENSRQLVGPEVGLYLFPLYGNGVLDCRRGEPVIRLALDYGQLADYCLSEGLSLFRRKYDRAFCLDNFLAQLEREYDKVFFDEEHTGFAADSRFFSLLCNACLEVADPADNAREEWRIVLLKRPEEVDYRYGEGMIWPFTTVGLPVTCLRGVALMEANPLLHGTLIGFLRKAGLPAEQLLDLT